MTAGAADALAQAYYFSLKGGYNHPHEGQVQANGVSERDATLDPGGAAAVAFGFEWTDGWRFEGEVSWRRSEFDRIGAVALNDGRAGIYAATINVYYGLRRDATVNPYLGVGIGAARLSVDGLAIGGATVDDFGYALAWQGMAGVDLNLSPSWKLSIEYRYFSLDDVKLTDSLLTPFKTDYQASTAMLGVRVGF